ncbi:MAG: hypothetical protein HYY42_05865 [Chloroflexi bacterium]|nr:hypothetical protein [Chloroflexota bacterium]
MEIVTVVAVLAVVAAVVVMWAIASGKISDLLVVRPAPGIAPVGRDDLWFAEMALAREEHPWTVRPCPEEPRAHFVAEWKLADARWWGLAQRNGLSSAYRAWFAIDERRHELRCTEERSTVRWSAGAQGPVPAVSWSASSFQGIVLFERTREIALGLRDEPLLSPGVVVDYDFDPWRAKGPIVRIALERGWSYRPVASLGQLRAAAR